MSLHCFLLPPYRIRGFFNKRAYRQSCFLVDARISPRLAQPGALFSDFKHVTTADRSNDQRQDNRTLIFRFAGRFGELRIRRVDRAGSSHSAANLVHPASNATPVSRADSCVRDLNRPSAASRANAASRADSVRGRCENCGQWITDGTDLRQFDLRGFFLGTHDASTRFVDCAPQPRSRPPLSRLHPQPTGVEQSAELYSDPVPQLKRRPEARKSCHPVLQNMAHNDGLHTDARSGDVMQDAIQCEQHLAHHDQRRWKADALIGNAFHQAHGIHGSREASQGQLVDEGGYTIADDELPLPRVMPPVPAEGVYLLADADRVPQGDQKEQQGEMPSLVVAQLLGQSPVKNN